MNTSIGYPAPSEMKLIIKILGDIPEGYDFNGKTFIKVEN